MKNKKVAVAIEKVQKRYFLRNSSRKAPFFALKNINLKIFPGEKVAILGDNGAGKTTLLKLIAGIAEPTQGKITRTGKIVSLIDITAGFQPEFSGRENIYLNGILLGLTISQLKNLEQKIINFSGIVKFIDQPLYTYSSGMVLRLGFSIAINADPDILILDEGIIVGDQDFQKKAYDQVEEIFARGKTIIVSSHMLPLLRRLCRRFVWLDKGQVVIDGGEEVLIEYKKSRDSLKLEETPVNKHAALFFEFIKKLPIGEKFSLEIVSGSMEPLILKGDSVLIERIAFSDLKKGDIIAFWSKDLKNIVLHRFYKMEKGKIVAKGDSNVFADSSKISEKNFLGVLVETT